MKCPNCQGLGYLEYEAGLIRLRCTMCGGLGVVDDNASGAERDNQPVGSGDTGKPKQPKKPGAKKKARKRTD